jgi:MFS family permease
MRSAAAGQSVADRSSPHSPPSPPVGAGAVGGTFGSLRIRNFRLFFVGQGISVCGTWMQNIAIGWLSLQSSHSGVVLGLITAGRYLPILLLGQWGGLVADRRDNRRLLLVTQTCSALVSVLFVVVSMAGLVSVGSLLALVLLLGLVNVFDGPARQILPNQLVDRPHLANAISLTSVMMNAAKVIGPAVAGVVIATLGMTTCFVVNAISFVAVIVSIAVMDTAELYPPEHTERAKGQIREGMTYVRRSPSILHPLLLVIVTGVLTWEFPVSLPLITTDTFHAGAGAYGAAMASMGAGAVAGGLVAARRRHITVRALCVSAILWGGLIVAASLAPDLAAECALLLFVGAGAVTFNSAAKTLLQIESAPAMRGRVMALWSTAWQGGTVIGAPAVGVAVALLGGRSGLWLGGAAAVAIGVLVLVLRASTPDAQRLPAG